MPSAQPRRAADAVSAAAGVPRPEAAPSRWLAELGEAPPRPALSGNRKADVCIVGAGYTGLWTAYELLRAAPDLEVVVLEARFAGFGASGRNGGWVLGELAGAPERWLRRAGQSGARALLRAIEATVDEVGATVRREGIECDFVKSGTLTVAQTDAQLARLERTLARQRAMGFEPDGQELLGIQATRRRVAVSGVRGALFSPHCARVQPAKLARGLAAAAERAGAIIHEATPALSLEPGLVRAPRGSVRARWTVRATEGYTAGLPGLRRVLLPMNSSMIVTEPLDSATWRELGWERAETLRDAAHVFAYLQRTADGRVAIGGRGVPYRFASRTDREGPVPTRTVTELRERLSALFPPLADAPLEGAWHGVLGVARDWMPGVGLDSAVGLAWAGGYVGEGVAASNLAGRTLSDLVLGRDSKLTGLPWVGQAARAWELEPLRFLGARGVYGLYRAADRREWRTGRPSRLARLADRVAQR